MRPIPLVPAAITLSLWPLPLTPLQWGAERLMQAIVRRHPSLFARLGVHAAKRFLIVPTDLPYVIAIEPNKDAPRLSMLRAGQEAAWDARIAGPIGALLGLIHGAYDGDALFFSRDLIVEGDVEAALALRNALDDAELDLVAEAAAALGPLAGPAENVMRLAVPTAERVTGLVLTRATQGG